MFGITRHDLIDRRAKPLHQPIKSCLVMTTWNLEHYFIALSGAPCSVDATGQPRGRFIPIALQPPSTKNESLRRILPRLSVWHPDWALHIIAGDRDKPR